MHFKGVGFLLKQASFADKQATSTPQSCRGVTPQTQFIRAERQSLSSSQLA